MAVVTVGATFAAAAAAAAAPAAAAAAASSGGGSVLRSSSSSSNSNSSSSSWAAAADKTCSRASSELSIHSKPLRPRRPQSAEPPLLRQTMTC
ncbi:hypothetical protein Emag_006016 [Eimeria magna]